MVRQSAKAERVFQRIREDMLTDLDLSPSQIKDWFTSNIIDRSIGYMAALTSRNKAVMLRATEAGILKTAAAGGGFEHVDVKTGTATTGLSGEVVFDSPVSRLRFVAVDYDLLISTSSDGVQFEDLIYVKAGTDTIIDIVCKSFKVQKGGTNDSVYRIEGYW